MIEKDTLKLRPCVKQQLDFKSLIHQIIFHVILTKFLHRSDDKDLPTMNHHTPNPSTKLQLSTNPLNFFKQNHPTILTYIL